jgi:predicted methyltransferase
MSHIQKSPVSHIILGCFVVFALLNGSAVAAADIAAVLVHPDRPSADADNDARRKPVEVLTFAGLETGMSVLELEAGGGYYTEIISRAVGPNGNVILQHPPGLMSFVGDGIDLRTAGNRLANVAVLITDFDDLDVPDNSIDMVTWIQGPHELGFAPEGNSLGDPRQSFSEIARVLKPGGLLVASDHMAPNGSGIEAGGTLNRIAESVVTELALNAGLSVLRSSNVLKNTEDPLDVGVFAPAVRGNTSQFLIVYQK